MVVYGTGLGGVQGGDNTAGITYDFTKNGVTVAAVVGGVSVPALYAGRAGFPGEDQINFQLPANVQTGCTVPFQISVNGTLSAPTFLSIAPAIGAAACVQSGFSTAQLTAFDNGASYNVGTFSLSQVQISAAGLSVSTNSASGGFLHFTGFQLSGLSQYAASTSTNGACTVIHSTGSNSSTAVSGGATYLDAGTVTLNGPATSGINNVALKQDLTDPTSSSYNSYSLTLGGTLGGTGTITAGQYTIAGAGGKDVNSFSTSITVGAPITVVGGLPSTVNRGAGLTLNWTGGNANDLVQVIGSSSTTTGSGASAVSDTWLFSCTTTAGAKTITVPPSVLQQLPAVTAASNAGFLEFSSSVAPASFTAGLKAGGSIDSGTFLAFLGSGAVVAYQ